MRIKMYDDTVAKQQFIKYINYYYIKFAIFPKSLIKILIFPPINQHNNVGTESCKMDLTISIRLLHNCKDNL